jgi:hypothetical protein
MLNDLATLLENFLQAFVHRLETKLYDVSEYDLSTCSTEEMIIYEGRFI